MKYDDIRISLRDGNFDEAGRRLSEVPDYRTYVEIADTWRPNLDEMRVIYASAIGRFDDLSVLREFLATGYYMIHPFEAMAVAIIGMSDPIRWGGRLGIWGMWSSSVNQRIAKDVVSAGKSLFGELESLDEPPPNKDGGEPVTLEEAWASLGDAFKVLEIFERALRAGIVDERFRAVLALSCLFDEEEPLPETAHAIVGDIPPIGGDPLWAWAWCAVGWSEVEVIRRTEYAAHTVEDPEWFWDRMDMTAKRLGWSHVASEVAKRNR